MKAGNATTTKRTEIRIGTEGEEEATAAAKYSGTYGRRKHSVARVYLVPGTGKITINKRTIDEYLMIRNIKVDLYVSH